MVLGAILLGTLAGCKAGEPRARVSGKMRFVLGGTSGVATALRESARPTAPLVAGDEYIVSPRKAKITFTSVVFRGATETLGTSEFTGCTVIYDRSLNAGATLLDCPFTAPVGELTQIALYFNKEMELLVSDATVGIYSDAATATRYSTTAPSGGATFVPFTVTIGDASPSRATPIIFAAPVTIAEGTTPTLYVTTDMIHTVQLKVNAGGTTLTANPGNDPVALFGGIEPGTSSFYSGATTVEAIKVQGVPQLRIFADQSGKPLYVIGPTCGVDGPKGAWASPPIGSTIGGWLGKDANGTIAWALPTDASFATYSAYFTMAARTVVGQTTTLNCKATSSPPAPADGKTYAAGAPAMSGVTTSWTLRLLAK